MVGLAAVESDRGSRLPLRADLLRVRASGPGRPWPGPRSLPYPAPALAMPSDGRMGLRPRSLAVGCGATPAISLKEQFGQPTPDNHLRPADRRGDFLRRYRPVDSSAEALDEATDGSTAAGRRPVVGSPDRNRWRWYAGLAGGGFADVIFRGRARDWCAGTGFAHPDGDRARARRARSTSTRTFIPQLLRPRARGS